MDVIQRFDVSAANRTTPSQRIRADVNIPQTDRCEDTERKGSTRERLESATEELRKIANKILDDAVRDHNETDINRCVRCDHAPYVLGVVYACIFVRA